jgi:hypothetical protein
VALYRGYVAEARDADQPNTVIADGVSRGIGDTHPCFIEMVTDGYIWNEDGSSQRLWRSRRALLLAVTIQVNMIEEKTAAEKKAKTRGAEVDMDNPRRGNTGSRPRTGRRPARGTRGTTTGADRQPVFRRRS